MVDIFKTTSSDSFRKIPRKCTCTGVLYSFNWNSRLTTGLLALGGGSSELEQAAGLGTDLAAAEAECERAEM